MDHEGRRPLHSGRFARRPWHVIAHPPAAGGRAVRSGASGAPTARSTADGVPQSWCESRRPSYASHPSCRAAHAPSGRVSHPTAREPEGDGPSMGHDRFGCLRHSFGMSLLQSASSKCRWRAQAHGESTSATVYADRSAAISSSCSKAARRSSAIWSGGGRLAESSMLSSRSQKISRFALSRFTRSS